MCGRYSLLCIDDLGRRFRVSNPAIGFRSHFNIAPSAEQPVIVHGQGTSLVPMRWGLIPSWAKDPAIAHRLINARAETLLERPAFRSLVRDRRCLVPASGFFEWKKEGDHKVPYFIRVRDAPLFAFAGLCDTWKSPDGTPVRSFSIITTRPNGLVAQVHDRMPAILLPEHEERWVEPFPPHPDDIPALLAPYPAGEMEMHRVSDRVNSPANDTPDMIEPVERL
jgi:putative SOS response-associated peptidase YedK